MVLMTLFDVMDDTVAVKKAIFGEVKNEIKDLLAHPIARKVRIELKYLCVCESCYVLFSCPNLFLHTVPLYHRV